MLVSDQTGGKQGVNSNQGCVGFQENRRAHCWAVTCAAAGALCSTSAVALTHVY